MFTLFTHSCSHFGLLASFFEARKKACRFLCKPFSFNNWYPGPGSNRYALRRRILSLLTSPLKFGRDRQVIGADVGSALEVFQAEFGADEDVIEGQAEGAGPGREGAAVAVAAGSAAQVEALGEIAQGGVPRAETRIPAARVQPAVGAGGRGARDRCRRGVGRDGWRAVASCGLQVGCRRRCWAGYPHPGAVGNGRGSAKRRRCRRGCFAVTANRRDGCGAVRPGRLVARSRIRSG